MLVSSTIAYATLSTDRAAEHPRAALASGKSAPRLKARGKVTGLYPGAVKQMRIRITNKDRDPVKLRFVKTKARDASTGCTSDNIAVTREQRTHTVVPARSSRGVRITVQMLPSAVDACQGARFPLRFRVRGSDL